MDRKRFLQTSTSTLIFPFIACTGRTGQSRLSRRPNIILIYSDDQGYNDLGCFGGPEIITPSIDRIAAQGMRFTRFYVTCPVCGPSRASILTGRYPQRNGMTRNVRNRVYDMDSYETSEENTLGLDVREILISNVLKQAGYTTAAFGKWDSGRARQFLPLQRGFDYFYGHTAGGIDYYFHTRYGIPQAHRNNELIRPEGYSTELYKQEALNFIDRNRDRPFFMYLAFNAPHFPSNDSRRMQAPKRFIDMYGKRPFNNRVAYMAAVTCMDYAVGEIMTRLENYRLADNTIVIFISDNGGDITHNDADNTPLRKGKATMFEGGIRVPAVIKWPGVIDSGQVCDRMASTLDVFPTLAEAAGAKLPDNVVFDGVSIVPLVKGEDQTPHNRLFWKMERQPAPGYPAGFLRAAIVGGWKIVQPLNSKRTFLFNLKKDLREGHDFSQTHPGKLEEMEAAYKAWELEMAACPKRGPFR